MSTLAHDDLLIELEQPGASWKDKEEHVIPQNRLGIVFVGLMCALFLTQLELTIVTMALPTIVEDLAGGTSYSWVGSAYVLSAGAFGPLYGKLSNMFGRKSVLYSSIFIFLFGSVMCGAARSMNWLIAFRTLQGVGGGGIMQLVQIIISDIVPLKDRGRYGGASAVTFTIASVAGPILGGALTQHISWRWCFFINLPIGGIAAAILLVFLNLNPHDKRPIRDQVSEFDFIGLICFVAGTTCLLLGFDLGRSGWAGTKTSALLSTGIILLVAGGINETFTKRSAVIPARLFKTRTTSIILVTVLLHSIVFYATTYYLPLLYQVLGASVTHAGIKMLPFLFGISFTTVASGFILSKIGRYCPIIWVAYIVLILGMSLMTTLDHTSNLAKQVVFPLIAAAGMAPLFHVPLVGLQAAMPLKDMATSSSSLMFVRTIGGAFGMAIGETIIASVLPHKVATIPNFANLGLGTTAVELNNNISKVRLIPDATLRDAVLYAWSEAIDTIWVVSTPMCGIAFCLTLFLREYSLDRKVVHAGDTAKTPGKLEERNEGSGR